MSSLSQRVGMDVRISAHMPDFTTKIVRIKRSGGMYGLIAGSRRVALRRKKERLFVVANGTLFCSPANYVILERESAQRRPSIWAENVT